MNKHSTTFIYSWRSPLLAWLFITQINTFKTAFLSKCEIWNPTESWGYRSWQKTVFGDTEQMQFRREDKANLGAAFTSGHKSVRDGPKLPNFRF